MSLIKRFAQSLGFCELLLIDSHSQRLNSGERVLQKTTDYLQYFDSFSIRVLAVKTLNSFSTVEVRVKCSNCQRVSFCSFRCPGVKLAVSQQLVFPGEYVCRPWTKTLPYTHKPVVYLNCANFEHVATCTECSGRCSTARLSQPEQLREDEVSRSGETRPGEDAQENVYSDGDGRGKDLPEGKNHLPTKSGGEDQGHREL